MMARIKRHADTLHYLCYCKNKKATKAIVNPAQPDLINCFSEICTNVLNGNVPLSAKEKNKLKRYKNYIREMASKSSSQKSKRRVLQKGGFIGAILKPLIGLIGPLLSGLSSQK